MALLTNAQTREHVESDLSDDALDRLIADADAEIIDRLGAVATETQVLRGGGKELFLGRAATSISSIVERENEANTTLATNDYTLRSDNRVVERLTTGTNGRSTWAPLVTIAYVPVDTTARRKRLLVDLVRLACQHLGVAEQRLGDVSVRALDDYQAARDRLFSSLGTTGRRLVT